MHRLAVILRAAQLFAHNAHNLARGATFFADHKELGKLYETYEGAYDSVVERILGLGEEEIDLNKVAFEAVRELATYGAATPQNTAFKVLLEIEEEIRETCEDVSKGQSIGTVNFLQGLADESEQRSYLLGQRMK